VPGTGTPGSLVREGGAVNYTGKPYDPATGMYNYGYRDYAPELARFTTVDPIRDNWFVYVNNDPGNWIDPWGLSASDGGRAPTEAEKQLYEQASGHSIDYDNIRVFINKIPTSDKARDSLEGIGISTRSIPDSDINAYVNHPDMVGIALPDGNIYMYDSSPSLSDVGHKMDHQRAYQKGATITVGNDSVRLNTAAEVVNQLIKEGMLYDQSINPYTTPGYLEYQAREIEREINRILTRGTP
jgi:RHS repeat-associated protein